MCNWKMHFAAGREMIQSHAKLLLYFVRHYSAVLFCNSTALGCMLAAITFTIPNIGGSGLIAVLSAYIFAARFNFSIQTQEVLKRQLPLKEGYTPEPYIYNSLLFGLSLGYQYQINTQLVLLIVVGAVFTVILTQFLSTILWRLGHLPVLSLPFVLVTWMFWLATKLMSGLQPFVSTWSDNALAIHWFNGMLKTLGLFFFIPHPLAGLIMILGIVWVSRYLALLALAGYFTGYLVMVFIVGHAEDAPSVGFNFMLVAMAIGGIFTVPSKESIWLAGLGAALCAILAVTIGRVTLPYGIPVLTMPFVLTTLVMLAGLRYRHKLCAPYLLLEHSDLPEVSYERMRLMSTRTGEIGSVPLFAPFLGQWQVYQGFNGPHTHQPPWQHALDFFMLEGEKSFRNEGKHLQDYYCFGATIVAPAPGQIVACSDALPDNPPGEVDTIRNWGNYIQIKISSGQIVVLAHLRQNSLLVKEGEWVSAGQCIASCGNSGRSPQPHLHLHLQNGNALGSPTIPFHLSCVITRQQAQQHEIFQITARPAEMESVSQAGRDDKLAMPLRLSIGRCLYFRFRDGIESDWLKRSLKVELTLLGQFRLVSDSGASVTFEENAGLLAFYDRKGGDDKLLDMWVLALGLTPLTSSAAQWLDKPSARLMPLERWQSILLKLRPLVAGINSRYQRSWDSHSDCWLQHGDHELRVMPGVSLHVTTQARISPQAGCQTICMQATDRQWQAELEATGASADHGVPAWVELQKPEVSTQALKKAADWST